MTNNHADAELLALEAKLVDEYTAMDAKRGITDDEVNEWTARLDVVERQFARMPAHTLDGVAAKLRRLKYSKGPGGDALPEKPLVRTALAGLERVIEARGQTETDAELLRLGDEHKTFLGEVGAGGHDDAKGDPWGVSG